MLIPVCLIVHQSATTGSVMPRRGLMCHALALALAGWVLGDLPAEPKADQVREAVSREPVIGPVLADCLVEDPLASDPTPRQRPRGSG